MNLNLNLNWGLGLRLGLREWGGEGRFKGEVGGGTYIDQSWRLYFFISKSKIKILK